MLIKCWGSGWRGLIEGEDEGKGRFYEVFLKREVWLEKGFLDILELFMLVWLSRVEGGLEVMARLSWWDLPGQTSIYRADKPSISF